MKMTEKEFAALMQGSKCKVHGSDQTIEELANELQKPKMDNKKVLRSDESREFYNTPLGLSPETVTALKVILMSIGVLCKCAVKLIFVVLFWFYVICQAALNYSGNRKIH